jgi:hypothetical protein
MKKTRIILLATFMVGLGFATVNAQDKTWVVSKDVQKVANKKQYENTESEKSHLKPTSYSFPAVVLSKDVQKVSNPSLQNQAPQGNIVSKGTPDWVVSKGVHRSNKSKAASDKKNKEPEQNNSRELAKAK